jgi:hypothetical protein
LRSIAAVTLAVCSDINLPLAHQPNGERYRVASKAASSRHGKRANLLHVFASIPIRKMAVCAIGFEHFRTPLLLFQ